MENTALNGTTNATKDHEDWKKKKGYGPILVAVSLALLLSLYVGGYLGSSTHLRHDEMKTTNTAASSPSTSLVGSGTAASLSSGLGKGNAGDQCKHTSECKVPEKLDHAVCRRNKCQQGAKRDFCGIDSDCAAGMFCLGVTKMARCEYLYNTILRLPKL